MIDMDEIRREVEMKIAADKKLVAQLLDAGDFLDDDGYPTDDALTIIEKWDFYDDKGWFDFINSIWYLKSWGWDEGVAPHDYEDKQVYRYSISTAGWSGNESIIHAMQNNAMLWGTTWVQSRRGGHYIFERDVEEETTKESE